MLSFISAKEAAKKWNISQRRVSVLASEKRIDGAMMVGNMWIIPSTAEKPVDKRTVNSNDKCSTVDNKSFEITIEESVSKSFIVNAMDEESAMKIAVENYDKGIFALEAGNVSCKQMQLHDIKGDTYTEWFEF